MTSASLFHTVLARQFLPWQQSCNADGIQQWFLLSVLLKVQEPFGNVAHLRSLKSSAGNRDSVKNGFERPNHNQTSRRSPKACDGGQTKILYIRKNRSHPGRKAGLILFVIFPSSLKSSPDPPESMPSPSGLPPTASLAYPCLDGSQSAPPSSRWYTQDCVNIGHTQPGLASLVSTHTPSCWEALRTWKNAKTHLTGGCRRCKHAVRPMCWCV